MQIQGTFIDRPYLLALKVKFNKILYINFEGNSHHCQSNPLQFGTRTKSDNSLVFGEFK